MSVYANAPWSPSGSSHGTAFNNACLRIQRVRDLQAVGSVAIAVEREQVVDSDAGAEHRGGRLAPRPRRHQKACLANEVGCSQREDAPLPQALAHHSELVGLEIADAAVDVLRRCC